MTATPTASKPRCLRETTPETLGGPAAAEAQPCAIDVDAVKSKLQDILRRDNGDDDVSPVVVCEWVAMDAFDSWLERHEGELRRWLYEPLTETHGRVLVYSCPSKIHAAAAWNLNNSIISQLLTLGGPDMLKTVMGTGATAYWVGDRKQEADASFEPFDAPAGSTATLVIEVAYKNESWSGLVDKLHRWLGPSTQVQVAIGVKICARSPKRKMIVLRRNPDDPEHPIEQVVVLDSQDAAADAPRISFPARLIYDGGTMPLALHDHADAEIVIDVVKLLAVIANAIEKDAQAEQQLRSASKKRAPALALAIPDQPRSTSKRARKSDSSATARIASRAEATPVAGQMEEQSRSV